MSTTRLIQLKLWIITGGLFAFIAGCGGQTIDDTASSSSSSSASSSSNSSSSSSSSASSASSSSSSGGNVFTLVLEEDSAGTCQIDGIIEAVHTGFSGIGYANGDNFQGNTMIWQVNSEQAGQFDINLRYANGTMTERSAQLSINKETLTPLVFPSTNEWTQWRTQTVTVNLTIGANVIRISADNIEGLPNIDHLAFSKAGLSPGNCSDALPAELPQIAVWIAGDSTVANGQTPCPAGWGKYLQEYFNNKVSVRNSAAGGRSVRTWLYDVLDTTVSGGECAIRNDSNGNPVLQSRWQEMLQTMKPGDYLLIQFGINDGSPTCPRHVGSEAFKSSYGMMAQEAKARGVHPIFLTPVSAIRCNGSAAVATRGFLNETFQAGNDYDVPVLDLHTKSIELYNNLGFCPVAGNDASAATTQAGPIGDFFCDDHTHFDNPGARQMAHTVTELLQEHYLELAAYLK